MTARLTLLAAGATRAALEGRFPGDEPLAARVRDRLAGLAPPAGRFARIVSSPARAARETAAALGLAATVDGALAEPDMGTWTGRALVDLGAALGPWRADPAFRGHGGESLAQLLARAGAWAEAQADPGEEDARHTLAIASPLLLRAIVAAAIGMPAAGLWHIDVAPLTLADLRHDGRRWALRGLGVPLPRRGATLTDAPPAG